MRFKGYNPPVAPVADLEREISSATAELAVSSGLAYALVQGYPYSGLVRYRNGVAEMPPPFAHVAPMGDLLQQFWDLRIFGKAGERHFWRIGGVWQVRTSVPVADTLKREYPIWGTYQRSDSGWDLYSETGRGIEVWVPSELTYGKPGDRAKVVMQLIPAQDGTSGLAQIVDSYITEVAPWL